MRVQILGLLLASALASSGLAQGRTDVLNVESPQTHAIRCVTLSGHDYLVVCNTPDNSIEVYDTDETIPVAQRFLARVPVGLEPVSVTYNEKWSRLYVANFLGDSVCSLVIRARNGPSTLQTILDQNVKVGDEPMHLTFTEDDAALIVSFNTTCAIGFFDPIDLTPILAAPPGIPAPTEEVDLIDDTVDPEIGIKEPHIISIDGDQVFVLGFKGGNRADYDFDLYSRDLTTGAVTSLGGLGSTNFDMAFTSFGDLWVVGGEAQNHISKGPNVAAAPTGFVESTIYLVQGAGTSSPQILRRDLNEVFNSGSGLLEPVSFDDALAMPTAVLPFEFENVVKRIYITAFGSDAVAAITPSPLNNPDLWQITRIPIDPVVGSTNPVAGPRALALGTAIVASGTEPRLYCLNRLDNSVTTINPMTNLVVGDFALSQDPTPDYIRKGQQFLYSAKFSGSGMVSCSSCHTDGRTDALAWDLGNDDPTAVGAPFPRLFSDGPISILLSQIADLVQDGFDPDKGLMVTQSLQGLLNFEVDPDCQTFYTNQPYHWRGDKANFTEFNEAFVNLMGGANVSGDPADPKGISDLEMKQYEEYVHSIHYPPNPQQPFNRRFSGDFGPDATANDVTVGDGGLRGLKVFHTKPLTNCAGRSCVECHNLTEGSNNHFTVNLAGGGTGRQPLESAALRGLFQKESSRDKDGVTISNVVIGNEGLEHHGATSSINDFVKTFFVGQFAGVQEQRFDLQRMVHELDWGVAPGVGTTATVTQSNMNDLAVLAQLGDLEGQANEVNLGVAVHARFIGGLEGYWFDPTQNLYVEESSGATQTRQNLLDQLTSFRHRIYFFATPLGSERRVGSTTGIATSLTGPAPTSLVVHPLATNTAYEKVPLITKNWSQPVDANNPGPDDFVWGFPNNLPTPLTLHRMRLLQFGLINDGQGAYGITAPRHDAPRRFRISGESILPGARLVIHTPNDPTAPVPDPNLGTEQMVTHRISLPIYASNKKDEFNNPIWETAAELEPSVYYAMLNGGPFAPGVDAASNDFQAVIQEPPPSQMFDPIRYNFHHVQVENPDGNVTIVGWVQLSL